MNKNEPVTRSILVCGSCGDWLPLVVSSLRSNGFNGVSEVSPYHVAADYIGGSVSVSLSPAADGLGAFISVSVVPFGGAACGA